MLERQDIKIIYIYFFIFYFKFYYNYSEMHVVQSAVLLYHSTHRCSVVHCTSEAVLRWCGGHVSPAPLGFTCCHRFICYLTVLTWFLRSQNAPKSKFSGAPPRTPPEELTTLPKTPIWWEGGSLPPPKNPTRSRPFGPRFYRSQGLTHYWQPMIDFKM